jgi:hypothetical protein
MTAQISDKFMFRNENYELIGMRGGNLFSPEQVEMQPKMIHTACYRGFYATYEVNDDGLYLLELTIREANDNYIPINGRHPKNGDHQATYHNLNLQVLLSGKIRLARGFIKDLYIHMGFQKPTAFKTVYDLTFNGGRVQEIKDRSEEMEKKRGAFKSRYESGNKVQGIGDAFSLNMDIE